jgi:cyclohexa-1,5-dienecarbonyl-CoA hydratase
MNALPMTPGVRLVFEEGGALARVVFDGGKGNVIDRPLLRELARALREAEASDAKAVLLEGAGDHFSFGASVEEHRPAKVRDFLREFHALFRELLDRPLPRIAVVRGQCLGGGLELALACQRIFAARGAKLGQPEIKLAVFAPVASLLLPQRIGQPAADDLLLTGRSVAAEEALALGLVDSVADDPLVAARDWVRTHLLPLSASSLRFAARAAWTASAALVRARLDELEKLYLDELMATPDAVEGITAFLEKRPPVALRAEATR